MLYISHLLKDEEMKDLVSTYHCGVESIEFSVAQNLDTLPQSIYQYRKRLEQIGTRELIVHGPFLDLNPMSFDKWALENTFRRYEQSYQAAKALGAKKIVYHTCYVPKVYLLIGWAERVADFYNKFLEKKEGIEVVMENVQDPEITPILHVAQKVEHPNFGLCFDVGHANCYSNASLLKWTQHLGPYIKHLHLHDNHGRKDEHLGLGMGEIALDEVIESVLSCNPTVSMTIECAKKESVEKSLKWLQKRYFVKNSLATSTNLC
jgi:sugar phosphate isomerase/epimerase